MSVRSAKRLKQQNPFMGRIRQNIDVKRQKFWTLFDTGAINTYIVPEVAKLLATSTMRMPHRSAIGGKKHKSVVSALLDAKIEGHHITTHAMVLDKIGKDEEGKEIEVLFGALAMQQWGIRPLPKEEKLDMSHYPETFVEF